MGVKRLYAKTSNIFLLLSTLQTQPTTFIHWTARIRTIFVSKRGWAAGTHKIFT